MKGIATNDVGIQKDGAPKVNIILIFHPFGSLKHYKPLMKNV